MKTKGISFFLIVMVSMLTVSCYKEAYKVDDDFVGGWDSVDGEFTWEIATDGNGSYTSIHGDRIIDVVKANNKYLKIGGVKFQIDQFPRFDSSSTINNTTYKFYSMVLNDITYIYSGL